MKAFHSQTADEAIKNLNSSESGLTDGEAARRLQTYGANALKGAKKRPLIVKFFAQFADVMIIVLLAAAAVSAALAIAQKQYADLVDGGIILIIVIVNAVIGLVQESRAQNALDALKEQNKPFAKAERGGRRLTVPSEEIVVGDIVVLEAGDVVPADMRLTFSASLKIEEAALTGESLPVEKDSGKIIDEDAPLGDRINMAYAGGTVTYGRGRGVVTATGMNTETGKIADMLAAGKSEPSPLTRQLGKTARILSAIVLAVAAVIFIVAVCRRENQAEAFMTAVAIAVAAIPEGLPAVVTIVLALGVQKMSAKGAIVRSLSAVETLGCCEVICSDKTGTLTLNKMTVKRLYCPSADENLLCNIMALCNDAALTESGIIGDPTETALVDYIISRGTDYKELAEKYPRLDEKPFDSERKLMTTLHKIGNERHAYTKGAPDLLAARCDRILTADGVAPLTGELSAKIAEANREMADGALRVLAGAYKTDGDMSEQNMIFVGLVGMIDPPRAEVKAAVEKCRSAGIRALMITGDHMNTAAAIARELDILRDGDLTATGAKLDKMKDGELEKNIEKYSVFARVSPENKVRVVKAFKANGKVVAMTGDGVNDAPGIKAADIGIGMGVTGTQVCKQAADMVLTDDNFATIVGAVEEGRKIFSNITKAIQFLLSANIAEVLCLFIASVILNVQFLTPVMILWVNLITDSFPALSLGMERAESDVMRRKPRKSNRSLFAGAMGRDIVIQGVLQTVLVMLSFLLGNYVIANHGAAMTMAFVSLCFIQLFHAYNLRSQKYSILNGNLFGNKFMNISFLLGAALTLAVVLIPVVNTAFGMSALNATEWLIAVGVALAIVPVVELEKLIARSFSRPSS